jgi:excisionase family DNA binding protein
MPLRSLTLIWSRIRGRAPDATCQEASSWVVREDAVAGAATWSKDIEQMPATEPEKPRFPKLLTLAQVKEVLNVGMPTLYALLSSGELRGMQVGGRRYLCPTYRLKQTHALTETVAALIARRDGIQVTPGVTGRGRALLGGVTEYQGPDPVRVPPRAQQIPSSEGIFALRN